MSKRFLKSSRPSLLIKRAALGNLKASFHCAHWHRFFPLKKEFSKTYPSFLTVKEEVFSTSPSLLQGRTLKKMPIFGKTNENAVSFYTCEQFSDIQIPSLF